MQAPDPSNSHLTGMDAKDYTLKPNDTGCRHSFVEGSFFKIGGMSAAECFTCDRLIAWSIETVETPTAHKWIAEKKDQLTPADIR